MAPAAILLIDLDHFKNVNDTHGHLAGDVVLKEVAEILVRELRGYDAVGRYGGEEFIALLPGVSGSAAAAIGERLRDRIAQHTSTGGSGSPPRSASRPAWPVRARRWKTSSTPPTSPCTRPRQPVGTGSAWLRRVRTSRCSPPLRAIRTAGTRCCRTRRPFAVAHACRPGARPAPAIARIEIAVLVERRRGGMPGPAAHGAGVARSASAAPAA